MRTRAILTIIAILLLLGTMPVEVQAQVSGLEVSPGVISAGPDYAYDERGYYWGFDDYQNFAYELSRNSFAGGLTLNDGWLSGKESLSGRGLYILNAQIIGTNPTQNEGVYHPIIPANYRYLTLHICLSQNAGINVAWYRSQSDTNSSAWKSFKAGCGIYTIDLVNDNPYGPNPWLSLGSVTGLALFINEPGVDVLLNSARLTPTPSPQPISINWVPKSGTVDLIFSDTLDLSKPVTIDTGVDASKGNYAWEIPPIEPDLYYITARFSDGSTLQSSIRVNHPPKVHITDPSFTSGPDYATTIIGNAWDFSSANDVKQTYNMINLNYENSFLTANNTNEDPIVIMNTPLSHPIDANRFFYLTYRMRDMGPQSISKGSVTRVFYKPIGSSQWDYVTSADIVIYEGWRDVTIDMRNLLIDSKSDNRALWDGFIDSFRIDPLEFSTMRTFQIDDIKLTGYSNARMGSSFIIDYETNDPESKSLNTQLFYGASQTGPWTSITCLESGEGEVPVLPLGPYLNYLPLIQKPGASGCTWTANVAPGLYYIQVVSSDGIDITTRVSEAPIQIW